ncbi:hypothetical protein KCU61_g777, partial [Aureobasidium melanogenum]
MRARYHSLSSLNLADTKSPALGACSRGLLAEDEMWKERNEFMRSVTGCNSDLLDLDACIGRVDVSDDDIAVVLATLGRSITIQASSTSRSVVLLALLGSLLRRVPVVPHATSGLLCPLLGGEELICVAGLLCTVGVNRSKTLLDEQLSEALAVDVQLTDEASNLVSAFNIDFDIALLASAVCKFVCLLAERLALLVGVASRARSTDTGQDESELGILTRYQDSESASTLDKEGKLSLGLINGSTVVDIFGLLRGLRIPHALSSALCSLLGGKKFVVDRRTVSIIHAVSDDRGVSLLNEHKTHVLVVESDSGHLTLIEAFSSRSLTNSLASAPNALLRR